MFSMIQRDFGIINTFENLTTKKIKSLHWPTACRYFGERSNKTNRPKPINPSTLLEHPNTIRKLYGCTGAFSFFHIHFFPIAVLDILECLPKKIHCKTFDRKDWFHSISKWMVPALSRLTCCLGSPSQLLILQLCSTLLKFALSTSYPQRLQQDQSQVSEWLARMGGSYSIPRYRVYSKMQRIGGLRIPSVKVDCRKKVWQHISRKVKNVEV